MTNIDLEPIVGGILIGVLSLGAIALLVILYFILISPAR